MIEYKIPKSTIRSFIDFLKNIKVNLKNIEDDTHKKLNDNNLRFLTDNSSLNNDDYAKNFKEYSLILDIINHLRKTVDNLIYAYEMNDFRNYIDYFDVIVAALDTNNDFLAMIILDVIRNNSKLIGENFNKELEKEMAKLVNGYQINGGYEETESFLEIYGKYVKNGYDVIKVLNNFLVDKEIIAKRVNYMRNAFSNLSKIYPKQEENEMPNASNGKKVYPKDNTHVYTQINPVKYYINGGIVQHLCDPKEFNKLLIKNGYNESARYNLNRQMISKIAMQPEKRNALIGLSLQKMGNEYLRMWQYIETNIKYFPYDILNDFYNYYYTIPDYQDNDILVPGIFGGYGYSEDDINYFMLEELKSIYTRINGIRR